MRLFTALEISPEANAELRRLQAALGRELTGGRMTAPENFHVTVHFLGEVPSERLSELDQLLSTTLTGEAGFALALDQLGAFPKHGRVNVMWTGLSGELDRLHQLEQKLRQALQDLALLRPDGRFSPHLTLVRDPRAETSLRELARAQEVRPVTWRVDRLVLFQSVLGPKGSTYTVVNAYPLK